MLFGSRPDSERFADTKHLQAVLLQETHIDLILAAFADMLRPARTTTSSLATLPSLKSSIFLDIVASLTIIVRQRRDLLTGRLPQLAQLSGRLVQLLSVSRQQLGKAQLASLQAQQPVWAPVDSEGLDDRHARALSRLLTSISAKTVALSVSGKASDKIDSLAKPFGRHAIHVLIAYVRALIANPLLFIPASAQRSLEPGLFALCEIISSYDRDAALVGLLDEAGQTLMKRIWSQWEAQRYKGQ